MITVFARTILVYLILIVSMRLMGKRQVGELQISELIVTIMLSDFAATPIYETDIPFAYAIIPILLLLSVEVILSYIIPAFVNICPKVSKVILEALLNA